MATVKLWPDVDVAAAPRVEVVFDDIRNAQIRFRLTQELVYIAVSIANSCPYCVHSHIAAARAKRPSEAGGRPCPTGTLDRPHLPLAHPASERPG